MKSGILLFLLLLLIHLAGFTQVSKHPMLKDVNLTNRISPVTEQLKSVFLPGKSSQRTESAASVHRHQISSLDSCKTLTYRLKIGNTGSDESLHSLYKTVTDDILIAGKTNSGGSDYAALLARLNPDGALQWAAGYREAGFSSEFAQVRETSDGGMIAIGSRVATGPSGGSVIINRMNAAGVIQWSRQFSGPSATAIYKGADIVELEDNSFAFTGDDGQSVFYGVIDAAGNLLFSRILTIPGTMKALRVLDDYNGIFLGCTGQESGRYVSYMMKFDKTNGNILWSRMFGGLSQQSDYIFHNIEMTNLRPRIMGIVSENGQPYQFFRITINTLGSIDLQETYSGTPVPNPSTAMSATTPWSKAHIFSDGISPDIRLVKNTSETGIKWSYQYPVSGSFSFRALENTFDGGYLAGCNNGGDILLIKVDSAGLSPSCPGNNLVTNRDLSTPLKPDAALTTAVFPVQITASVPARTLLTLDTVFTCKQLTCPVRTPEDTCLRSFLKTYNSYDNCDLIGHTTTTSDNMLFMTGIARPNPYDAEEEYSLIMKTDYKGNLTAVKIMSLGIQNSAVSHIRLQNDNQLLFGHFSESNSSGGFYLSRLDNNLNQVWHKNYKITDWPINYAGVCESASGEIFVFLYYYNFPLLQDRIILIKLDNAGNMLWQNAYKPASGISLFSNGGSIKCDGNALYLTALTMDNDNKYHTLVMKVLQSDGSILWDKRYRYQTEHTELRTEIFVRNNQLFLYGTFDYNATTTMHGFLKLDTMGNISRFSAQSKNLFSFSHNLLLTSDGNLVSSAYNYNYNSSPSVRGNFFMRMDSNFTILSSRNTPTSLFDGIGRLTENNNHEIFAGGSVFYEDPYLVDPILKKFNTDGTVGTCPSDTFAVDVQQLPLNVTNANLVKSTLPLLQQLPLPAVLSDHVIQQNALICGTIPDCDTLWLSGPPVICDSNAVYEFRTNRNPGCTAPVQWQTGNLNKQILHQSDSLLRIRFLQSGTFTLKAKLYTGCRYFEDSLPVTITIGPGQVHLGPDTSLCPGNTQLLNAHKGFVSYEWQDGSADSTFLVTSPGWYWVKATDACNNVFTDSVLISAAAPVPFSLGPDLKKCNTDTLNITATPGFLNYTWSPAYNITTVNGQSASVFPYTDTSYTVIAEKTPGCFAYDTIRIQVIHSAPVYLGADTSLCAGDFLTLQAPAGFTGYLWSNGSTTPALIAQTAGLYTLAATDNNGCISRDSLTILNIYSLPVLRLPADGPICTGSTFQLSAGNGFAAYSWNTGATTPSIAVSTTGLYWVRVTDNNGCRNADSILITSLLPLPSGFLPADTGICSYSPLSVSPNRNFNSYRWSNGFTGKTLTITQPGLYWLEVTDANQCTGRDSVFITPAQCPDGFHIPTAFTPGHDGKNDLFRPLLFGNITDYHFTVFNRYGQKVFESRIPGQGWDGTFGGREQDANVFVWLCSFRLNGQEAEFHKGTVMLIR